MSGKVNGKVTTLVGVGRDNVQVQLLTLPPAPADELPDMVRFQAERDFTALGNEAALDFVPVSGDAQTPNQVLAVALNSIGVVEARDVCEAIGVEPNRPTFDVDMFGERDNQPDEGDHKYRTFGLNAGLLGWF